MTTPPPDPPHRSCLRTMAPPAPAEHLALPSRWNAGHRPRLHCASSSNEGPGVAPTAEPPGPRPAVLRGSSSSLCLPPCWPQLTSQLPAPRSHAPSTTRVPHARTRVSLLSPGRAGVDGHMSDRPEVPSDTLLIRVLHRCVISKRSTLSRTQYYLSPIKSFADERL